MIIIAFFRLVNPSNITYIVEWCGVQSTVTV